MVSFLLVTYCSFISHRPTDFYSSSSVLKFRTNMKRKTFSLNIFWLYLIYFSSKRNKGSTALLRKHSFVLQSYARVELDLQEAAPTDTATCAGGAGWGSEGVCVGGCEGCWLILRWCLAAESSVGFGRGQLPLWLKGLHADLCLARSRGLINAAARLKSSS